MRLRIMKVKSGISVCMLQEAIRNYTQCYSVIAAVQGEVLARWLVWNFPLDFCLEQQHQLIR